MRAVETPAAVDTPAPRSTPRTPRAPRTPGTATLSIRTLASLASVAWLALGGAAGAQVGGPGPAACLNLGNSTVPPPAPASPPPLAEQLARDRIRPGSALARLVAANQDFGLLRPGEIGDGKPLPPWLRVHWLKAHPQSRYVAADPNGGYPAVLRKAYQWMLGHQDLAPGPPPKSLAPGSATGDSSAGGEQRISGPQAAAVNDSEVRINFFDPSKVIAAADGPTGIVDGSVEIFYSADGGASWGRSSLPATTSLPFQADGAVEWASDGTAWATAVTLAPVNEVFAYFQVRSFRSADSGKTWTFDALLSGSQPGPHRDSLRVDRGASSPFKDNVYVTWNEFDGVYLARRSHSDGAWHNPILISDVQTVESTEGAEAETNSAGELFVFWADGQGGRLFVAKSTDGGVSFGAPVVIATTFGRFRVPVPAFDTGTVSIHVNGGVWKSMTENNAYAAWADMSGEAGCTIWTEAPTFVTGGNSCKSRVWFSRSTDGGQTWSPPVKIDDRRTLDDQFSPALAVDEASGKLSLTYYDTAGDPARVRTNLFYQSSSDGGITWSDPLQVTSASSDETVQGSDITQYGDHNGLSAAGGAIVATWTDRRNGGHEEVWSAAISDPATCSSPAATGLQATAGPAGVNLAWDAVAGATYRVFRAPASGGPYSLIATTTLSNYFDAAGSCGATSFYAVRAVAGCASALSAEATAIARPTSVLYGNDFESGSGLADWTTGALPGFGSAADWQGIQACPAHSGSKIFRFGGATCASGAGPGDIVFAYPHGPLGIPIPAGAADVKLSFWHRRDFQAGSGGLLALGFSDILDACLPVPPSSLSGETFNGVVRSTCAPGPMVAKSFFTGTSSSFTNTVVDLDQAFSETLAIAGSTAGHVLEPLFLGFTDCGAPPQTGWFVDDVQVSACTAAPAPAYGFYTIAPCRLLDTRQPAGPGGGPALGPSAARDLALAGRCGVPPTAKALSVNVTVVAPSMAGSLILYADDQALPSASTISFAAGAVRANNAIVSLGNGTGGAIAQNQSAGSVDLLIDVDGYFQ